MTWTKAMYFPKMLSKYICMYEMQMFYMLSMHQRYVMLWNAMFLKNTSFVCYVWKTMEIGLQEKASYVQSICMRRSGS